MALIFESFLYDFVAFLIFCAVVLHLYIRHIYSYWEKRNVKYVKPTFPFGNLKDVFFLKRNLYQVFKEIYNSTDDKYIGVFTADKPALFVRDPELCRLILTKDFQHFQDRGVYCNVESDPLSGHLFSLSGERWKNLRFKLTPAFSSGRLKAMFPTFLNCGKSLEEYLKTHEGEEIDTYDLIARFGINVVASVSYGLETDTFKDDDSEFRSLLKKFFNINVETVVRTGCFLILPHLGKLFKIKSVARDYEEFIYRIVKETVTYREENNVQRKDFLQLLLQLKNTGQVDSEDNWSIQKTDNSAPSLTLDELAAQVHIFFLAGFETSATTMSFCLFQLARYPKTQAKVQAEIDEVIKKHNGEITYEALMDMPYLENCLNETLRLNSPLSALNRECTIEYELPGTGLTLEKGTRILIPFDAIHYDPKYFTDPEEFKPERFEKENFNSVERGITYMPFGYGPRICIGARFGMLQSKIGLVLILSKFNIHLGEHLKDMKKIRYEVKCFTPTVEGGTMLKFLSRK